MSPPVAQAMILLTVLRAASLLGVAVCDCFNACGVLLFQEWGLQQTGNIIFGESEEWTCLCPDPLSLSCFFRAGSKPSDTRLVCIFLP